MLRLTKLDGSVVYLNDQNIQWIEAIPDTAITFLGGARILVREKIDEVLVLLGEGNALSAAHVTSFQAAPRARGGALPESHSGARAEPESENQQ